MIYIPSGAIVPLFIASFVLLAYQYFRVNPDRRVLNLRFGLMLASLSFMIVEVAMPQWSLVWFLLALCWFGWTIVLLRRVLQRP